MLSWKFFFLVIFVSLSTWAFSIPVQWEQNFAPTVIENRSGLNSSNIYFMAHGLDDQGVPCFLVPDATTGKCAYVYPDAAGNNNSVVSSKTLAQLPPAAGSAATDEAFLIYFPINSAARGYFSINKPLFIETSSDPSSGFIMIGDPSQTALNDPNFYTLYQDFELTFTENQVDSGTNLFLNLSYVDHFTLPMQLGAYKLGDSNPLIYGCSPSSIITVPAGMGTKKNRGTLIKNILDTMNLHDSSGIWSRLGIFYYDDPYTDSTAPTVYLRVLAAKNSIGFGTGSSKFVGAAYPQTYFPSDYISNTAYGQGSTNSFINAVYQHYLGSTTLEATITPGTDLTYTISSFSTPNVLLFNTTTVPNQNLKLNLMELTTEQLFSGGKFPFEPQSSSDQVVPDNTAELQKLMSGLFTIGKFPIANSDIASPPFHNNQIGYQQQNFDYFSNPKTLEGGPWWNVYDLAVHLEEITNNIFSVPNSSSYQLGNGYAYDFDDLLNMSGLIGGLAIQDIYGNNPENLICVPCPASTTSAVPCGSNAHATPQGAATAYALMTLEDMGGMTIPDVTQDTYSYKVSIGPSSGVVAVQFDWYDNEGNQHSTTAPTNGNQDLTPRPDINPTNNRKLTATFSYEGVDYVYDINLHHQLITPIASNNIKNAFTGVTRKYQAGVQFTITNLNQAGKVPTGQDPEFLLTFDTSTPPWNQ
ncbi:beta-1,3-glucanase family protein [Candidatus Neptunichlamydia sp. REUL1]|uniref:beta-1,3-glucanase family protein n=1 Tax=Candidatus Neptunichlamydia sp. REUL1 TaxID=3064277 RepID=UPI0029300459|nr:beta-1,3-glucanase family protein [Candidatus Neptunochlamydia sp. REUL1]